MSKNNIFILCLLLISCIGGIWISRYTNRPQQKDWYFNVTTGEVMVVDSVKKSVVFGHSELRNKTIIEKESVFRIHYKKIKE